MIEIKENLLRESLRECKDLRKTTNFENMPVNPWHDHELQAAKLIDIDFNNKVAEVQTSTGKTTVPLKIKEVNLETLQEIGGYYGITAFLDPEGNLVNYSYITDDMLTLKGVDVQ